MILLKEVRLLDMNTLALIKIARDKRLADAVLLDVYEPLAVHLLEWVVATQPPGDLRLFRASASTLRKCMAELCRSLGWEGLGLVPHSLRHEGTAYNHYVRGLSVADVQIQGRCHSSSSCHAYLAHGRACLASQTFSQHSKSRLRKIRGEAPRMSLHLRRLCRKEMNRRKWRKHLRRAQ